MSNLIHWITPTALIVSASSYFGVQYLTIEQAQKACSVDRSQLEPSCAIQLQFTAKD